MDRIGQVREVLDNVLADRDEVQCGGGELIHLYGVSMLCVQLALRRGLDPEVAATAGMLHDIYRLRTGIDDNHAHNSEEDARTILRDLKLFSHEEQVTIRKAIFSHSSKSVEHGPYDEVVKDADVLQRYLYDTAEPTKCAAWRRLQRVSAELRLPKPERVTAPKSVADSEWKGRRALGEVAEKLARQPLMGNANKSGPDVYPLIRYFPGATPSQGFDWCASFVYHCCRVAGLKLPIRYPGVSLRFAAVPAWLEWSQLPELQFFHAVDDWFEPERGDLVIFDRLVSDAQHDHIGIVLEFSDGVLTAAEGNVANRSGVFQRDARRNVSGYVRIADGYRYNADVIEPAHIF